jgi:hypothetical protein
MTCIADQFSSVRSKPWHVDAILTISPLETNTPPWSLILQHAVHGSAPGAVHKSLLYCSGTECLFAFALQHVVHGSAPGEVPADQLDSSSNPIQCSDTDAPL